jgi:hypothetical protein
MTEHKELVDRLHEGSWGCNGKTDDAVMHEMNDMALEAARVIEEQAAEIARLREALEFYAVDDDWWEMKSDERAPDSRQFGSKLGGDYGETARAALTHPPETGS